MPADPAIPDTTSPLLLETVMVVHGPLIFDTGDAARLIHLIAPRLCLVAGVMGRTAAEESGLPVRCCGEVPSSLLLRLRGPVFLANRGKTPASGQAFGAIVAAKLAVAGVALVQVECSDRTVYVWNGSRTTFSEALAAATGFSLRPMRSPPAASGRRRTIHGCLPGEPVCINGIVIGTATSDSVVIGYRDGLVEAVSGITIKAHGIEKLARQGPIDLATAWCKSGPVRYVPPRAGRSPRRRGKIVVIDHCGCECYERIDRETCGVLAIGDDTTMVCGHICSHLGIPVFGVIDGDVDGLVEAGYAPGSIVVRVSRGRDDDVGRWLADRVLLEDVEWDAMAASMLDDIRGIADVVVKVPRDEDVTG